MRLLFWNLNQKENSRYIDTLLREHQIDIAVFAEFQRCLFSELPTDYELYQGNGGNEKLVAVAKKAIQITVKREQNRYTIYELYYENDRYVLVGVHLPDRRSEANDDARKEIASRIITDLQEVEDRAERTIIIGDFNCNPFDSVMTNKTTFNAVLFKKMIRQKKTDIYQGKRYKRFYNPTLLKLSEDNEQYGSYYKSGNFQNICWHSLDQVLVRQSLADHLTSLQYCNQIGKSKIVSAQGIPDNRISDHLPLVVEINT